jgi:DNA-binding transcriptional regulator LsrR (DeoR family)
MFKPNPLEQEKLDIAYQMYVDGREVQDIARRLGIAEPNVAPYLKEARQRRLREIAEKDRQENR